MVLTIKLFEQLHINTKIEIQSQCLETTSQCELELGWHHNYKVNWNQIYSFENQNDDLEGENKILRQKLINQCIKKLIKLSLILITNQKSHQKVISLMNLLVHLSMIFIIIYCLDLKDKKRIMLKNQEISLLTEQYKIISKEEQVISIKNLINEKKEFNKRISKISPGQSGMESTLLHQNLLIYSSSSLSCMIFKIKELQSFMQSTQKQIKESIQLITSQYPLFQNFPEKLNLC
ncbi:unnamed protein product [Paramecium octaurelia]|uniref:Transmembrane protein n=1 Tax=Paramecium octaurelia TaxID=43137 RepID=A0A8S1T414_PAROT|nr:unnamed protein product [Paramecium octaurelia]